MKHIFHNENLLPADFFHVLSIGPKFSAKICSMVGSVGSHDGLVLDAYSVGEARIKPPFAGVTSLEKYEKAMRTGHCKVCILRIPNISMAERHAIADAWVEYVQGDFYDFGGIWRLWAKERLTHLLPKTSPWFERALGWEWAHWCTEANRTACLKGSGGRIDPLGKQNPTPRTVENRVRDGRLVDVSGYCLTEEGLEYRLMIPESV